MKRLLLVFSVLFILASCDNTTKQKIDEKNIDIEKAETAKNSVDWAGIYKGNLPCASCEGIETTITLRENETFKMHQKYLGEDDAEYDSEGMFSWEEDGSTIIIKIEGETFRYFVQEGSIAMLTEESKEVTNDLAEYYILKKQ